MGGGGTPERASFSLAARTNQNLAEKTAVLDCGYSQTAVGYSQKAFRLLAKSRDPKKQARLAVAAVSETTSLRPKGENNPSESAADTEEPELRTSTLSRRAGSRSTRRRPPKEIGAGGDRLRGAPRSERRKRRYVLVRRRQRLRIHAFGLMKFSC